MSSWQECDPIWFQMHKLPFSIGLYIFTCSWNQLKRAHPNPILKFSHISVTLECEKLGNVPKAFKPFATHSVKKFTLIPYGKPLGVYTDLHFLHLNAPYTFTLTQSVSPKPYTHNTHMVPLPSETMVKPSAGLSCFFPWAGWPDTTFFNDSRRVHSGIITIQYMLVV